jgi:porphyrinogen peroxidase
MLERMFIGDPPGNYDRILDFSTAVTGSLCFVPTSSFLEDSPPLPGAAPVAGSPDEAVASDWDGSLGIGGR